MGIAEKVYPIRVATKMLPFAQKQKRIKVAVGGRGSQKTTAVSDLLVAYMADGAVVCGGREMLNSIEESVHSTLVASIERLGIDGFDIQKTQITHYTGGRAFYKGLSRNPSSVKSTHGVDIWWMEEASTLSQDSLDILIPTARKAPDQERMPELWFTFNRGSSKDPASQTLLVPWESEVINRGYYEDDIRLIVQINWRDNPWFMESGLNEQRVTDQANMSPAKYGHIWGGEYNDEVEDSIILPEWFDACIDAHERLGFKAEGQEIVSFDPSDSGDEKGLAYRHGSVVHDVQQWDNGDVNEACDKALDYAISRKVDLFTWDADGMGVSLRRQVSQALNGKKIEMQAFKGSEGPENPKRIYEPVTLDVDEISKPRNNQDTFRNQRAQFYIALRDRCYKTFLAVTKGQYYSPDEMISFSSKIEDLKSLRAEVCRIPEKPNGNGKIQILSKPEMKKAKIASPNMADAVMMSMKVKPVAKKPRTVVCADAPPLM